MRASTCDKSHDHLLRGKTQTCRMNFQGQLVLPYPRQFGEALSRLPTQGVTATTSSSTSSSTSVSTSRSNSNSQEVRTCAGRQTVIVFVWNLVCYLKLNIWPFSFFLSYCSVCCWFLWFACCSSSSIKIAFGTKIPCFLHIFSHRCVTLLMLIVARLWLFNDLKRKPYGLP